MCRNFELKLNNVIGTICTCVHSLLIQVWLSLVLYLDNIGKNWEKLTLFCLICQDLLYITAWWLQVNIEIIGEIIFNYMYNKQLQYRSRTGTPVIFKYLLPCLYFINSNLQEDSEIKTREDASERTSMQSVLYINDKRFERKYIYIYNVSVLKYDSHNRSIKCELHVVT